MKKTKVQVQQAADDELYTRIMDVEKRLADAEKSEAIAIARCAVLRGLLEKAVKDGADGDWRDDVLLALDTRSGTFLLEHLRSTERIVSAAYRVIEATRNGSLSEAIENLGEKLVEMEHKDHTPLGSSVKPTLQ